MDNSEETQHDENAGSTEQSSQDTQKRTHSAKGVIGIILAIIVLLVAGIYVFASRDGAPVEQTQTPNAAEERADTTTQPTDTTQDPNPTAPTSTEQAPARAEGELRVR